jgi:hypothetical protein
VPHQRICPIKKKQNQVVAISPCLGRHYSSSTYSLSCIEKAPYNYGYPRKRLKCFFGIGYCNAFVAILGTRNQTVSL